MTLALRVSRLLRRVRPRAIPRAAGGGIVLRFM